MAATKFVSYLRVSTQQQGQSGLGLEAQRAAVQGYIDDAADRKLVAEVVEVETGKKSDRPELAKALALCRVHQATLIIAKLDRLARNVAFVSNLMESSVEFVAVDFPLANRFMIHLLAAVAEYEARMISDRTKAALSAVKARGVKLGGERGNHKIARYADKGREAAVVVRREKATSRANDILPIITQLQANGAVTLRSVADGLNAQNIPAPRGGVWSAVQVQRVMA